MKISILLISVFLASASQANSSTPTIQSPALCSTLDHSTWIPVGTKCMTSKGSIYERVSRDNFGEAWKGVDVSHSLIWSNMAGRSSLDEAVNTCKTLGGALPERADFKQGEANGFREVLPNMEGEWYWTSTIFSVEENYIFSGDAGDFGYSSPGRYGYASVRCIVRE